MCCICMSNDVSITNVRKINEDFHHQKNKTLVVYPLAPKFFSLKFFPGFNTTASFGFDLFSTFFVRMLFVYLAKYLHN